MGMFARRETMPIFAPLCLLSSCKTVVDDDGKRPFSDENKPLFCRRHDIFINFVSVTPYKNIINMKSYIRIILLLCALIAARVDASASVARFANMRVDGASTVCSIMQDREGMMWIGTDHGLYSYDGYRMVPRFGQGSAQNVRIYSMCVVDDIIYMGTDNGLLIYDISRADYLPSPSEKLSEVRSIACWKGSVWLGTERGLYRLSPSNRDAKLVDSRCRNVYSLLPADRRLLVGTIDGLSEMSADGRVKSVPMPGNGKMLVNALHADRHSGCVWVGAEGAMYRYDGLKLSPVAALAGNSVKAFAVLGGKVYAGTDNGLYACDTLTHAVLHYTHDSREPRSIANNIVWTLFADRWGNLWAGTDQGLSLLSGHPQYANVPLADITASGDGNCLHAIFRDGGGTLWLGGTNGLIACRDNVAGSDGTPSAVRWYRQNSTANTLSHNRVRRIVNDAEGRLLVCTDHGINIYNPASQQFTNVIVTDRTGKFSTAWAYDIVDDRRGHYWIASYMGGVFMVAKQRMLAAKGTLVADRHIAAGLQGLHVWQLAVDAQHRVWASMYDNGLDCIDTRTMRVIHAIDRKTHVNYVIADSKGRIWAATDNAVHCFGTTAADNFTVSTGTGNSGGLSMLAEVEGKIWAFAGRQCCVIDRRGAVSRFAVSGIVPLAVWYDRATHRVVLGGNDAVMTLSPRCADGSRKYGRLMLSAMAVDGKPFVPDGGNAAMQTGITLTHRQNNVSFMFTDFPMAGNLPCVYSYKLDGVDRSWQYVDGERMEISYNSLPPGNYKLMVRAVGGDGQPVADGFELAVKVLPPWYLSAWMRLVYVLLAGALLWWAVNFYMMRRNLRAEREARQRVMQQSAARSAFFDNLSRQLKTPLGRMFSTVLSMLGKTADTAAAQRLELVRHDLVAMNRLIGECLDMRGVDDGEHRADGTARIDIVDFCRRAVADARSLYGRKAEFVFHTDVPSAAVDADIVRMQTVFERLLGCAADSASHAAADADTRVHVEIGASDRHTAVSFRIPGLSVGDAELPLVFNRYFSADKVGGNTVGGFNVLADLKDMADAQGATVSASNDGTSLTVSLMFAATSAPARGTSATASAHGTPPPPAAESQDARLLAKITGAVEAHIADSDFNVTRLQETLGLGSKLLYRKVKQMTGKTPVEFIRHIRMQRAAMLLREGKFSVSEVMYMVGYSNSSYFSKCFQKAYGITPADYSRKSSAALQ